MTGWSYVVTSVAVLALVGLGVCDNKHCSEINELFNNLTQNVDEVLLQKSSEILCMARGFAHVVKDTQHPMLLNIKSLLKDFQILNVHLQSPAKFIIRGEKRALNMDACQASTNLRLDALRLMPQVINLLERELRLYRDSFKSFHNCSDSLTIDRVYQITEMYNAYLWLIKRIYGLLNGTYSFQCLKIWRHVAHDFRSIPSNRIQNIKNIECLKREVKHRISNDLSDELIQTVGQVFKIHGVEFKDNRNIRWSEISGTNIRVNMSQCESFDKEDFYETCMRYVNNSMSDSFEELEVLEQISDEYVSCIEDMDNWLWDSIERMKNRVGFYKHIMYIIQNNKTDKCSPVWGIGDKDKFKNNSKHDEIHHGEPMMLKCMFYRIEQLNLTKNSTVGYIRDIIKLYRELERSSIDNVPERDSRVIFGNDRDVDERTVLLGVIFDGSRDDINFPSEKSPRSQSLEKGGLDYGYNDSRCSVSQSKDDFLQHAKGVIREEMDEVEKKLDSMKLIVSNYSDCMDELQNMKIFSHVGVMEQKMRIMRTAMRVFHHNIVDHCDLVEEIIGDPLKKPSRHVVHKHNIVTCLMRKLKRRINESDDEVYATLHAVMELQGVDFKKNEIEDDKFIGLDEYFNATHCQDNNEPYWQFEETAVKILKIEVKQLKRELALQRMIARNYSKCVGEDFETRNRKMNKISLYMSITEILHFNLKDKCSAIQKIASGITESDDSHLMPLRLALTMCFLNQMSNKTHHHSKNQQYIEAAFRFILSQIRDDEQHNRETSQNAKTPWAKEILINSGYNGSDFAHYCKYIFANKSQGMLFTDAMTMLNSTIQRAEKELVMRYVIAKKYQPCMPYDENWGSKGVQTVAENVAILRKVVHVLLSNYTDKCVDLWQHLSSLDPKSHRGKKEKTDSACQIRRISHSLDLDNNLFVFNQTDSQRDNKIGQGDDYIYDNMWEFEFKLFDDSKNNRDLLGLGADKCNIDENNKYVENYDKDSNDNKDDDDYGHHIIHFSRENSVANATIRLTKFHSDFLGQLMMLESIQRNGSVCFPKGMLHNEIWQLRRKEVIFEQLIWKLDNITDNCKDHWLAASNYNHKAREHQDTYHELECLKYQIYYMVYNDNDDGSLLSEIVTKFHDNRVSLDVDLEDKHINQTSCFDDDLSMADFVWNSERILNASLGDWKQQLEFMEAIHRNYSECFTFNAHSLKRHVKGIKEQIKMFSDFLELARSRKERCSDIWKTRPNNRKELTVQRISLRMELECLFMSIMERIDNETGNWKYHNLAKTLKIHGLDMKNNRNNGSKRVRIQGQKYYMNMSLCSPMPSDPNTFAEMTVSILSSIIPELEKEMKVLDSFTKEEEECYRNSGRKIRDQQEELYDRIETLWITLHIFNSSEQDNCTAVRGLIPNKIPNIRIKKENNLRCFEQQIDDKINKSNSGFYDGFKSVRNRHSFEKLSRFGNLHQLGEIDNKTADDDEYPFKDLDKIRKDSDFNMSLCDDDEKSMMNFITYSERELNDVLKDMRVELDTLLLISVDFAMCVKGSERWKTGKIFELELRIKKYENIVKEIKKKKDECKDGWKLLPDNENDISVKHLKNVHDFECIGRVFKNRKDEHVRYKNVAVFFPIHFDKPLYEVKTISIRGKQVKIDMKSCNIKVPDDIQKYMEYSRKVAMLYVDNLHEDITLLRRVKNKYSMCYDDLTWVDEDIGVLEADVKLYVPLINHLNQTRECDHWQDKVNVVPQTRIDSQSTLTCLLRQFVFKAKKDYALPLVRLLMNLLKYKGYVLEEDLDGPSEGYHFGSKFPLKMETCREPEILMQSFIKRAVRILNSALVDMFEDRNNVIHISTKFSKCFHETDLWSKKLLRSLYEQAEFFKALIEILTKLPGICRNVWNDVPRSKRDIPVHRIENEQEFICFVRENTRRLKEEGDSLAFLVEKFLLESGVIIDQELTGKSLKKKIDDVEIDINMKFCGKKIKDRPMPDVIEEAEQLFNKLINDEKRQLEKSRRARNNMSECYADKNEPEKRVKATENRVKMYERLHLIIQDTKSRCQKPWQAHPSKRHDIPSSIINERNSLECGLRNLAQRMRNNTTGDEQYSRLLRFINESRITLNDGKRHKKMQIRGLEIELDMDLCVSSEEPKRVFIEGLKRDLRKNIDDLYLDADLAFNLTVKYSDCFRDLHGSMAQEATKVYDLINMYEVISQILSSNISDECIFIHGTLPDKRNGVLRSRMKNMAETICLERLITVKFGNRNGSFSKHMAKTFRHLSDGESLKNSSDVEIFGKNIRLDMSFCSNKKISDEDFFQKSEETLEQTIRDLMSDLDSMNLITGNYSQCVKNTERWRNDSIPQIQQLIRIYRDVIGEFHNKSDECKTIWKKLPSKITGISAQKIKKRFNVNCFTQLITEMIENTATSDDNRFLSKLIRDAIGVKVQASLQTKIKVGRIEIDITMDACKNDEDDQAKFLKKWFHLIEEYLVDIKDDHNEIAAIDDESADCFLEHFWVGRVQNELQSEIRRYDNILRVINNTVSCLEILKHETKSRPEDVSSVKIKQKREFVCLGRQLKYKAQKENEPLAQLLVKKLTKRGILIADELFDYEEYEVEGVVVDLQMSLCKPPEKSMINFGSRSVGLIRKHLEGINRESGKMELIGKIYRHCYKDVDQWLGKQLAEFVKVNATFVDLLEDMYKLPAKCDRFWEKIPKNREDISKHEIDTQKLRKCCLRQLKHRMNNKHGAFPRKLVNTILENGGSFDDKKFGDSVKEKFHGIEINLDMSNCREKRGSLSEFMDHLVNVLNRTKDAAMDKKNFLSQIDTNTSKCFMQDGDWYNDEIKEVTKEMGLFNDILHMIRLEKEKCKEIWMKIPQGEYDIPSKVLNNHKNAICLARQLNDRINNGDKNKLLKGVKKIMSLRGFDFSKKQLTDEEDDELYGIKIKFDYGFCNKNVELAERFINSSSKIISNTLRDTRRELSTMEDISGAMGDCIEGMNEEKIMERIVTLVERVDLYEAILFMINNNRTDKCIEIEGLLPNSSNAIPAARVKSDSEFLCQKRRLRYLKDYDLDPFYENLVNESQVNVDRVRLGERGLVEVIGMKKFVNMTWCQNKKRISRQDLLLQTLKGLETKLRGLRGDYELLYLVVTNYSSCEEGLDVEGTWILRNITEQIHNIKKNIVVFKKKTDKCIEIWRRIPKESSQIPGEVLSNVRDVTCLLRRLKYKVDNDNDWLYKSLVTNSRVSFEKKRMQYKGKAKILTLDVEFDMSSCRDFSEDSEAFIANARDIIRKYTTYLDTEIQMLKYVVTNYTECFDNFGKEIKADLEMKERRKAMFERFMKAAEETVKCFPIVKKMPKTVDEISVDVRNHRRDFECLVRQVKDMSDKNESVVAEALVQEWENNLPKLLPQEMDAYYHFLVHRINVGIGMGACVPIVESRSQFIKRVLKLLNDVVLDLVSEHDLVQKVVEKHMNCFKNSSEWAEEEVMKLDNTIEVYQQYIYILNNWPEQSECEKVIDKITSYTNKQLPLSLRKSASDTLCLARAYIRYAKINIDDSRVKIINQRLKYSKISLKNIVDRNPVDVYFRGAKRTVECVGNVKIGKDNIEKIGKKILSNGEDLLKQDLSFLNPFLKNSQPCFVENQWFYDVINSYKDSIGLVHDLIKIIQRNVTHVCPKGSRPNQCDVCVGGDTGLPTTHYIDQCNQCTNKRPYKITWDCNDDCDGTAYIDRCSDICVGGNTGIDEEDFKHMYDCNGECRGNSIIDTCGYCVNKNQLNKFAYGSAFMDCNEDCYYRGETYKMAVSNAGTCNQCIEGKTGKTLTNVTTVCGDCPPHIIDCTDCSSVVNGKAEKDACFVCEGDGSSCEMVKSIYPNMIPANVPRELLVIGGGLAGKDCGALKNGVVTVGTRRPSQNNNTVAHCMFNLTSGTYKITMGNAPTWLSDYFNLKVYGTGDLSISRWSASESTSGTDAAFQLTATGVGFSSYNPISCKLFNNRTGKIDFLSPTVAFNQVICSLPNAPKKSAVLEFSLQMNDVDYLELSQKVIFYAPPPRVDKIFFYSGVSILIRFNSSVYLNTEYCSTVFTSSSAAKFGSRFSCQLVNKKDLFVSLKGRPTLEVGDSVTFKNKLISTWGEAYSRYINVGPYIVEPPETPLRPTAKIRGQQLMSSCSDLYLISDSVGGYGWKLKYHWVCESFSLGPNADKKRITVPSSKLVSHGVYNFVLTVTNHFNESSWTNITVLVTPAAQLEIIIIQRFLAMNNKVFAIFSRVKIPPCKQRNLTRIVYEWHIKPDIDVNKNSRHLIIPKGTLTAGRDYTVTVKVYPLSEPQMAGKASTKFSVLEQKLKPRIRGGSLRTVGIDAGTFNLDGRLSYDPDNSDGDLSFEWSCQVKNRKNGDKTCYSGLRNKITFANNGILTLSVNGANSAVLSLNAAELIPDLIYGITLSLRKGHRLASTSVTVIAVAGSPPQVFVQKLLEPRQYEKLGYLPVRAIILSSSGIQNVTCATATLEDHQYLDLTDSSNFERQSTYRSLNKKSDKLNPLKRYIASADIKIDNMIREMDYAFEITVTDVFGRVVKSISDTTQPLPGIDSCVLSCDPYTIGDLITLFVNECVGDPEWFRYFIVDNDRHTPLNFGQIVDDYIQTLGPTDNDAGTNVFGVQVCNKHSICSTFYSDPVNVTAMMPLTLKKIEDFFEAIETLKLSQNLMDAMIRLSNFIKLIPRGTKRRRRRSIAIDQFNMTQQQLDLADALLDQSQSPDGLVITLMDLDPETMTVDQREGLVTIYERILAVMTVDGTDLPSEELIVILQKLIKLEATGVSRKLTSSVRDNALSGLSNTSPIEGTSVVMIDDIDAQFVVMTTYKLLDSTFTINENTTGRLVNVMFGTELSDMYTNWDCSKPDLSSCQGVIITAVRYRASANTYPSDINMAADPIDISFKHPVTNAEISVSGLTELIEITFETSPPPPKSTRICAYWDPNNQRWIKTELVTDVIDAASTVCKSSHMTAFTVLDEPIPTPPPTTKAPERPQVYKLPTNSNTAVIVGSAVGGVVLVVAVAIVAVIVIRKKKLQNSKICSSDQPCNYSTPVKSIPQQRYSIAADTIDGQLPKVMAYTESEAAALAPVMPQRMSGEVIGEAAGETTGFSLEK